MNELTITAPKGTYRMQQKPIKKLHRCVTIEIGRQGILLEPKELDELIHALQIARKSIKLRG